MKSIVLVQIFSVKETNQTHSIGYVEDRAYCGSSTENCFKILYFSA